MSMQMEEAFELLNNFHQDPVQPLEDVLDEYVYPFRAFMKHLHKIQEDYDLYTELLSWCDLAREDITHHLEFDILDAVTRARMTSRLVDVLKTRRMVKNHLTFCRSIMDSWLKTDYVKVTKKLSEQIKNLNQLADSKCYVDRTPILADILGDNSNDASDEGEECDPDVAAS